jgi:hypothetical protein
MIKIQSLNVKNFMSVGNVSQAVNFENEQMTLVLGENLDQGGDDSGSRNGTGKCVCINTIVQVRNTKTGEIYEMTIGDLYNAALEQRFKR